LILAIALGIATADTPTTVLIGTPPQPTWSELNKQQRDILAPLSRDWNQMENVRRKKWLGIADRYSTMKPEEQQRVQQRMREWAELSADQRNKVRNTYRDFQQLPSEQKQTLKQKWEAYSNLPSDEKQRLRETRKSSTLLAPPPAAETSAAEAAPAEQTKP